MHPIKDDCYTTSVKYCTCIEFHLDEEHRHGFHTSQLIDYTLGPNPDAGEDKTGRRKNSRSLSPLPMW